MRACFPHNQFPSSTTVSVYGGVEVYNERSFCVKYRSQGVQTSFYESTPSASDSLGNTIPPGDIEDPGNATADFPNASEERNLRNISRHSRVLFERIHGTQGIWRVASSYRLKTTEPPHRRSSLSHAHHKLSAEYRQKRRLCIQNRSTGCILSCTNTSTQQEVHPVSKAREIWHTHAGYPPRKPCRTEKCPNLWDHSIGPQVSSHWVIYT